LIQTHLPELKHALQEHRLDLDTVRVDVQSDGGRRDSSAGNFQQDGRARGRGSNLGSSSAAEEKEGPPLLSPVDARGRVSVWA
jgi:flagellar hook-length control protein FliK